MRRLPISEVLPGQKLARAITNASGVVMVQPGTALTPALIERLQALGVDSVLIAGDPAGLGAGPSVDERLRELDARFAGHEQDGWMMQLKDIVARQLRARRDGGHA
jgi:putative cell wall-binding protein